MVSEPFHMQNPFTGMLSQIGLEISQNFLYPLFRKKLKIHVTFSITDLITHVLFLHNSIIVLL